ncbi:polyprenyl synthetase [Desulfosporosinus fructosivorans]|uniref:Polyprenyl synthetase n=1 Tax=Desulfosporosinus fructosivorans TaxID=2018669 RepID=A0A4Z0QZ42_9FIRM|nr:polyprenyl synthetase family protein [Desulfosporosinus fructosivorans]TGE35017.1 polyprenyl synthetase [Desulfosporosinus fructosivorans]
MNLQLDQDISKGIGEILTRIQLSSEMISLIQSSLNADSKTGELYKWAHLTLLSCECVSEVTEVALPGAIAMELFALAADIFDDIQDQDNNDLAWRKLTNANAINLAICLLMLSYEAVSKIPDNRLFREVSTILNRTGICASNAQFQEFLYNSCERVTLEQYFDLIKSKAGSLAACACKIGATLGGASESLVSQLDQYGTNLGIMSQIRNDLNDFLDFERKKDFENNTKTLPYVYLSSTLQGDTADQFKKLTQLESKGLRRFGNEERDYLKKIAFNEGAVHYCTVMFEIYRQKAMDIVQAIPVLEKRKEKLIKLVEEHV